MPDEVLGGNSGAAPEGPLTFEAAFAADASPASTPDPSAPNVQPTAAAASPESDPGQTTGEDDRSPYIPRARFDEINTKLKESRAWRESHAWADTVQPEAFQQMTAWFLRAQSDPRGFALGLLDEMTQHPEHAAAMRSELARRLGTRPVASPPADTLPDPDVEITDGRGRVLGRTYSADLLAKRDAFLRRQMLQEVDAKYAPHLETLQTIQAERQRLDAEHQAQGFASTFTTELAALPLFTQHQAEIGQALAQVRLSSDHPDAVRAAAYQAYFRIVGPKLQQGSQQAVLADLQRKAHASSSVNPGAAVSSTPARARSFHDLPPEAWT